MNGIPVIFDTPARLAVEGLTFEKAHL